MPAHPGRPRCGNRQRFERIRPTATAVHLRSRALAAPRAAWKIPACRAGRGVVPLATIPDCGHFVPEEEPAVVVRHLRHFLSTDPRDRPSGGRGSRDAMRQ